MNTKAKIDQASNEEIILTKIKSALSNPQWDFRTVQGIAKEAKLESHQVEQFLKKNSNLFRILPITDSSGRRLFTLASRPIRWKEKFAVFQNILKVKSRQF